MNEVAEVKSQDMSFGKKSFLSVVFILFCIMVFITILTYVIPAGTYLFDEKGNLIDGSYHTIESQTRLKWWQIPYSPISALLFGSGNFVIIQVMILLLALGGSFAVMEKSGGMLALVKVLLSKFSTKRKTLIWIVTFVMMLLASCFGLQEELLILFPIFLVLAKAMGWSNRTAISLVLLTTGVGFTTALTNPFTVGTASELAGLSILDGMGYRLIIFAFYFVFTSLYLVWQTKKEEKMLAVGGNTSAENLLPSSDTNHQSDIEKLSIDIMSDEEKAKTYKKAKIFAYLFGFIFVIMLLSSLLPSLSDYTMLLMGGTFVFGTFGIGSFLMGGFRKMLKAFSKGAASIAPALIIIAMAFSVKYIAEKGDILHTIFNSLYALLTSQSPFVAILILNLLVLVLEFFIPGAVSKAILLIPLLTLLPIAGISKNLIVLAFLFGDGFTNVLFPTCATLMVGLSLAKVSFVDWVKHTAVFQIALALFGCIFLLIGVALGY